MTGRTAETKARKETATDEGTERGRGNKSSDGREKDEGSKTERVEESANNRKTKIAGVREDIEAGPGTKKEKRRTAETRVNQQGMSMWKHARHLRRNKEPKSRQERQGPTNTRGMEHAGGRDEATINHPGRARGDVGNQEKRDWGRQPEAWSGPGKGWQVGEIKEGTRG